jgi:hypothetical protein
MASPVEVYDNSGRKVRAKMLVDAAGRTARDPITGAPLIVDEDFDMDRAIAFGRSLRTIPALNDNPDGAQRAAIYMGIIKAFLPGGALDMQRSYNGMVGGGGTEFVGAFRPAASYLLGVVGRAAGLSPQEIMAGAGLQRLQAKQSYPYLDTSGPYFNAPQNARWIEEGMKGHDSGRFFKPVAGGQGDQWNRLPDNVAENIEAAPPADASVPPQASLAAQNSAGFAAVDPQQTNRQVAPVLQATGPPSVNTAAASGLPQHVIDTGNYLRANGFEITPRTMYVANVLGPQGAVDLFKRTGSTSSDAVPSPDAATGEQMRTWARQLRLGPGAVSSPPVATDFGASAPTAPGPQAAWSNAAAALPGDVSEDAGLPV